MKQFYLSLLLLLAAVCAKGQTFTGKVTDSDNVPLAYANVVLLSLPDSTFVTGTVSEESGSFTLQAPAEGKPLLIRVSSIGYATTYKPCTQSDLGVIRLAFIRRNTTPCRTPIWTSTGCRMHGQKSPAVPTRSSGTWERIM